MAQTGRSASPGAAGRGRSVEFLVGLDRRYRRPLTSCFEKRIRGSYDIDDLVQEVFIRLAPAADWHSRLMDEDNSAHAYAEFDAWLPADARHQAAFSAVEQAWSSMRGARVDPAVNSFAVGCVLHHKDLLTRVLGWFDAHL